MLKLTLIAAGGALGSVLRYGIQAWFQPIPGPVFPTGTLLINVSGCFAIGLLATLFAGPFPIREEYRVAIVVGILGGFTTFSSFGRETLVLWMYRQYPAAALYVILSNVLGLLAVWLGHKLAQIW